MPVGHDGFLSSVIKNSKLRIHNCSSVGHDGLADRFPRSGKETNPLRPSRLRGSFLILNRPLRSRHKGREERFFIESGQPIR